MGTPLVRGKKIAIIRLAVRTKSCDEKLNI
jgi:hypothetical protein